MGKQRTKYSPEQKVAILKRRLVEIVPVSDICDTYGLHPTVFYRWQKQFFENGAAAFQHTNGKKRNAMEQRNAELEAKLRRKNEVLSELMEEHVQLKKSLGEL